MSLTRDQFLASAIIDCISRGIGVTIYASEYVEDEGGLRCAGWFDGEELVVAAKHPDWFEIFLHEYCHSTQYKDGMLRDDDATIWEWLDGKDFPEDVVDRAVADARDVEADNEYRVVALIKSNPDLGVDVENYIRKSNAYTLFYNYVRKHRKWSKLGPYRVPEILERMRSDEIINTDELPEWFEELVTKHCQVGSNVTKKTWWTRLVSWVKSLRGKNAKKSYLVRYTLR